MLDHIHHHHLRVGTPHLVKRRSAHDCPTCDASPVQNNCSRGDCKYKHIRLGIELGRGQGQGHRDGEQAYGGRCSAVQSNVVQCTAVQRNVVQVSALKESCGGLASAGTSLR